MGAEPVVEGGLLILRGAAQGEDDPGRMLVLADQRGRWGLVPAGDALYRPLGQRLDDVRDGRPKSRVADLHRPAGVDDHDVGVVAGKSRMLLDQSPGRGAGRVVVATAAATGADPEADYSASSDEHQSSG